MNVKRLAIFMLIPVISLLLWCLPAFAAEDCGDGCKMGDDYKKQMAQQALTPLAKVINSYRHYVNFLKAEYEGEGVCHHLYNPMNHNGIVSLAGYLLDKLPVDTSEIKFMHGLEDAEELEWPEASIKGADVVDNDPTYSSVRGSAQYKAIVAGGFTCSSVLERTGENPWKDYTDFHIGKLVKMSKKVLDEANRRLKEAEAQRASNTQMYNAINKYTKCYEEAMKAQNFREGPDGFLKNRKLAANALGALGGADTQCCCELDENGNMTNKITHCNVIMADFVEQNLKEICKTMAQYQAEMGEFCLTCGLMAKILGGVQKISKNAFETLDSDLIKLLSIAFLIYIAYLVLITIASPETQKISKFLTSLLTQGAKVAIAMLILTYPEALYDKVLNPILEGGVDFGLAFSNLKADSDGGTMDIALADKIMKEGSEYAKEFDQSSKYLHAQTLEKMVGANKNFSREAAMMPALGRCLICNSLNNLGAKRLWFFPRVSMLITGVILLVFGVMIWLAIGFYILDCCLQLGIVAAMMSFFVACWPFKITSSYVKVGWNMFLNTFFNFIMMSVVIVTIAQLTIAALPQDLMQDINEDNVEAINDQLEIIGLSVILLVVTCLICMKLSSESGRLANKFAGGAQIKMGGDLGGMAGDMATKGVKAGLKGGGKAVAGLAGSAAEASGVSGALKAGGKAIKEKLGGGTKSQGASFKPGAQNDGNDKKDGDKPNGDKPDGNKQ